jgi:anti-sigma regulatory factor (Ser/Thr protein kinase)
VKNEPEPAPLALVDQHDGVASNETSDFETIAYQEFDPEVGTVAEVREFVRKVLTAQHVDEEEIFACQLIADELATNALTHAGTCYSVAIESSLEHLRIAVRDDSRVLPVLRKVAPSSESGRGLSIITETATEWGAETIGLGKEAWADVAHDADSGVTDAR